VEPIYNNEYKLSHLFWLLAGISLATSQRALATAREAWTSAQSATGATRQQALSEHQPDHV